ncbi:hypothetical protein AAVH_24892 [Aphelenchoides avenae]|nr:hypothetical protein AAVH_24892 [Aphelenchus avenae]
MIGNSHAMMASEGIVKAFEGTFSTLRFYGIAGCSAFRSFNSRAGDPACDMFPEFAREVIMETKPNILIFVYMYINSGDPAINGSLDADPLLVEIRGVLREASSFADVYFADPMIEWPAEVSKVLGRRLQRNQSIENLRVSTKVTGY